MSGLPQNPTPEMIEMVNRDPGFKQDLLGILNTCLYLGSTSLKVSNLKCMDVIDAYAQYAIAVNGSMDAQGLNDYFGVAPDIAPLLFKQFGGPQSLSYMTYAISMGGIKPYLKHNPSTDVVIPLFIAFTVITTLVMALRLWSRHKVAGGIQPFDWLALLGYFMTVAWGALAIHHTNINGEYQTYYDKSWDTLRSGTVVHAALAMFYPWVIMVIKLSLLLFYYRMTNWNYIQWSVYITTGIVVLNTLVAFILWFVQCPHINFWDHIFEECRFSPNNQQKVIAGIYIATDLIIWILPMPLVFQLRLYLRERILAIVTFSLGAFACIASVLRVQALIKYGDLSTQGTSTLLIDAYTVVELNLALICASAPAVRALAIHYAPKLLSSLGSVAFTSSAKKGSIGSNESNAGGSPKNTVRVDVEKQ
ncbi:hypothetical protein H072_1211 [Dactylellina haptotyla CBS 200.50]|uniref:Rhodopsin domain-containing protein n=1 Tax=Dactylellina haptotyla (strain CBS 200.50) TaxID=1284197 RepID=S8APJ2_DACHA|nr:hypothetical protein H072_1211 [Dactylellina haptotyla CBS 200.50]